jgi:NAD(P)-dependent dehydrogenase (short-subunit alcohol dehydrogenase family)
MGDIPTALVIGASRGLGLAMVEEWLGRDWYVVATQRSASPELATLAERFPGSLEIETVDTTDARSVLGLRRRLNDRACDILLVNAGICLARDDTPSTGQEEDFLAMITVNAWAPIRFVESFADLVRPHGVIAVMSSELGSIACNGGYWELYSASKAALNMLMKCYAGRHSADDRAMLLVAPGWVRTDMGGPGAPLSTEQSIPHVVDMIVKSAATPGLRFVDRFGRPIPW